MVKSQVNISDWTLGWMKLNNSYGQGENQLVVFKSIKLSVSLYYIIVNDIFMTSFFGIIHILAICLIGKNFSVGSDCAAQQTSLFLRVIQKVLQKTISMEIC